MKFKTIACGRRGELKTRLLLAFVTMCMCVLLDTHTQDAPQNLPSEFARTEKYNTHSYVNMSSLQQT